MPYLKLKTSKLNYTQLGGTYQIWGRPPPPPPLNPGWSYPFLYECYLHVMSFPRGCAWCWFKRTRLPPSPCPGGSFSFLYECYLRVVRSHLHLHPPPPPLPNRRGELPFLYECKLRIVSFSRGFVSHPQPPGGVSLSCVNVAYTVVFP